MRALPLLFLFAISMARADGPADNIPEKVRPIPARGVEVPAEKKARLEAGLADLRKSIDALKDKSPAVRELLPDVEIFYRAVHDGLTYQEFLKPEEIDQAFKLLELGRTRAADLVAGNAPWASQTGLVVRGYVSKIDGSVQPYGLLIPESYAAGGNGRYRCDLWFHGRAEMLTEGNFLNLRTIRRDQIEIYGPRETIVLYPYGRYCTASKLAGEVDAFEALAEVRRRYRIDGERISVRGFSMGGAATWHMAVHHADKWFAANPGAGFSETPRFLDFFQNEKLDPLPWERKLWAMYDCDKWALNLAQCPTIAYSGEIDKQKQAADVMVEALAKHKIELAHFIAPKTAHRVVDPPAREIEARMELLARDGRKRVPRTIAMETWTLKYNRMHWVTVDGLAEHWARAEVRAALEDGSRIRASTAGVTALTFSMEPGDCPFESGAPVPLAIDGQELKDAPGPRSDRSWSVSVHLDGKMWKLGARPAGGLAKRHDLQGPIDDAFMDSFMFVRPTGTAANEAAGKWAASELERAIVHWRQQFRGNARVKDDTAVTDEDIASHNLVLWGDPSSNAVLKKIAAKLPIGWDAKAVTVGAKTFDATHHALVLIYPNPLNPNRYVVVNSSFTYREFAYLNNARQVPMLPDWAVIDLREPANTVRPGKVVEAGFFDEAWKLRE